MTLPIPPHFTITNQLKQISDHHPLFLTTQLRHTSNYPKPMTYNTSLFTNQFKEYYLKKIKKKLENFPIDLSDSPLDTIQFYKSNLISIYNKYKQKHPTKNETSEKKYVLVIAKYLSHLIPTLQQTNSPHNNHQQNQTIKTIKNILKKNKQLNFIDLNNIEHTTETLNSFIHNLENTINTETDKHNEERKEERKKKQQNSKQVPWKLPKQVQL
jgi:hypothetical protein